jgi:hypothetical protein
MSEELQLKPVPGYDNYFVDVEEGVLYSNRRGSLKQLKSSYSEQSGYYMNTLYDADGEPSSFTIHSIVMAAKQQLPINSWKVLGLTVHHRNSQREDNFGDNLELCSRTAQFTEELKKKLSEEKTGRSRNKVSRDDVLDILIGFSEFDGKITRYALEVADKYDMTRVNAYNILTRRTWKDVEFEDIC